MGEVRIGTSGWSYPSGPGSWNRVFYPPKARGKAFDELAYYAERFDTVEVNSSFYRLPDPGVVGSWVRRTPPAFDFSLKLYQKFTHLAMHQKATSPDLPGDGSATAIPIATRIDVDAFQRAIDPLAQSGKLGSLLAQFPPSFRDTGDAREYLVWLLQAFHDYPVAVELRHKSWSDHQNEVVTLLNDHGAAWAQIDEPKFRFSIRQTHRPNLRRLYYMRLHGRNAAQWWTHEHPDDRYNYLYTPGEIEEFTDTVKAVRHLVQKLYVYLNNHFAGKAVANALQLRHELGQPLPGTYPAAMVERYPALRGTVAAGESGLFEEPPDGGDDRLDEVAADTESRES